MSASVDYLRLIGSFGSGNVMAGELSRLVRRAYNDVRVVPPKKDGTASIYYPFNPKLAAVAVRYHRTSSRVLWELFHSAAVRLEPLYAELLALVAADRRDWLWDGARISVATHFVEDFAAGERQLVGTVKNAVIDGAAQRGFALSVDAEHPDIVVDVRLREGTVVVSLDLAGRPMHQRGYRTRAGEAPLREDLAALLVMLCRHDARSEALIDPLAGSGTIAIEAACMASGRYNWCAGRAPLAARLPALKALLEEPTPPLFTGTEPLIAMNELDPEVAKLAHTNTQTAGVENSVVRRVGDFRTWSRAEVTEALVQRGLRADAGGVILSNPPYGHRLGEQGELDQLYADLGRWCRQFRGFRAAFITANPSFPEAFGGRARIVKPLRNGQIKATFYGFDL
jgi:23S rRNA G2445 N2-methylase RlmL